MRANTVESVNQDEPPEREGSSSNSDPRGVTLERQAYFDSGGRTIMSEEIDYEGHEYDGPHGSGGSVKFFEEQAEAEKRANAADDRAQNEVELAKQHLLANPKLTIAEADALAAKDYERGKRAFAPRGDTSASSPSLRTSNRAAYTGVEARKRRLIREIEARGEQAIEVDAIRAARIEDANAPADEKPKDPDKEYLGAPLPELMDTNKKTTGGGGSKSKHKVEKRGTLVCSESGLECKLSPGSMKCGCLPCYKYRQGQSKKRGRPLKEDSVRDAEDRVRMTDTTRQTMRDLGLSASDALAVFGIAYRESRPIDSVITEWRARYAKAPNGECA